MKISLAKIESAAPDLVPAYKQTKISLAKHEHLRDHVARVALVLDISVSMDKLYRNGLVDRLVAKALPVGLTFDDDGEVDLFAFGINCYELDSCNLGNYKGTAKRILQEHSLEGGTYYARALEMLEARYRDSTEPVYALVVTDGETSEPEKVTRLIQKMSNLPLFIQWVGVGIEILPAGFSLDKSAPARPAKQGFLSKLFGSPAPAAQTPANKKLSGGFRYLSQLDEMGGRAVDNCNFFAIEDPSAIDDEKLYELLMNEYPQWVKAAKAKGILR